MNHLALGCHSTRHVRRLCRGAILATQLACNVIISHNVEWELDLLVLIRDLVVLVKNLNCWFATFCGGLCTTFFEFAKLVMVFRTLIKIEYHLVLCLCHFVEYVILKSVWAFRYLHLFPFFLELFFWKIFGNLIIHLSERDPRIFGDDCTYMLFIFLSIHDIQGP